jgi:hypothetical protein
MKIDIRRAAIVRDINAIREALGESALRLEQAADADDPAALAEAQARLAQVQAELTGTELKLVAHDAALEARSREEAARASADTVAEVEELIARIGDLHRSSTTRAGRLLRAIESIGPMWAEVLVELAEARALAVAAVHLGGGTFAVNRLTDNLDGHDILAGAVGPALATTGLGVTGPNLAPWAILSPPSNAFAPVALGAALERLHERRLAAIASAPTFGKTPTEAAA